jgi:hypothetical protein
MSDDLVARMRAAADTVISSSQAEAEEAPAQEPETPEPTREPEVDASGEGEETVEAEAGETEASAEAQTEEPEGQEDFAEQVLAIRQAAESRVRKAENYARQLEAKLEKAAQYIEYSKKQVVEDLFKKLRRAPARTFQEFGFDFQELIDAGMREGNMDVPFGELDEVKKEIQALRKEREEAMAERQAHQQEQQIAQARNEFLTQVTKAEYPTLFNMFSDDVESLWDEALRVAERHEERYGEPPEDIEVIRALEKKYADRVKRFGGGGVEQKGEAPAGKKAPAKTLTTKAASESRTAGKPFGLLSPDEQRAALVAAVKKATSQATN